MKSYQVTGNGLPLEEVISDKPTPKGKQVLIKTIACGETSPKVKNDTAKNRQINRRVEAKQFVTFR